MKARILLPLLLPLLLLLSSCGQKTASPSELQVTSSSLRADGTWDPVVKSTSDGKNLSPQLSWNAVKGASVYAVYMLDQSASDWLHWLSGSLTVTELAAGANPGQYVGPYPPSGTHTYAVWVFALAAEPDDSYPGAFNASNGSLSELEAQLDQSGGTSGNLLAAGCAIGTCSAS